VKQNIDYHIVFNLSWTLLSPYSYSKISPLTQDKWENQIQGSLKTGLTFALSSHRCTWSSSFSRPSLTSRLKIANSSAPGLWNWSMSSPVSTYLFLKKLKTHRFHCSISPSHRLSLVLTKLRCFTSHSFYLTCKSISNCYSYSPHLILYIWSEC